MCINKYKGNLLKYINSINFGPYVHIRTYKHALFIICIFSTKALQENTNSCMFVWVFVYYLILIMTFCRKDMTSFNISAHTPLL